MRTMTHKGFFEDVGLAIKTAFAEVPTNIVELTRGCLILARLGSMASNLPNELLSALGRVGMVSQAIDYAALIPRTDRRAEALALIAGQVIARGDRKAIQPIPALRARQSTWGPSIRR